MKTVNAHESGLSSPSPRNVSSSCTEATALELSREFVQRFWAGDSDWCAHIITPDFVWIGAQAEQFGQGAEEFNAVYSQVMQHAPRVITCDEEYEALPSDGKTFVVIAQYLGHTDPASSTAFADRQRLTLVWRATTDGLRLAHYHVSNPLRATVESEPFPTSFARETYRYALALTQQRGSDSVCELRDAEGCLNVLRLADVAYLEAQRQSTLIHCLNRQFRVRSGISDTAARIDPNNTGALARTHRSFAVNALYVERIGRDTVLLTTGNEVPLSARRRAEVEEQVARFFHAE